ncbi:hypothetical protein ACHAXR_003567, partial [Thalassiosira sp. AJA248-18]
NNVGNSEHVPREKQPWKYDKENKLQPRALESNGSILYYPVWTKGGYCDNDPFGRPDDDIKLYETVEECCEIATGSDPPDIISPLMKPSNQPSARDFSVEVISTGKEGCPCIDESDVLASLVERSCTTSDGNIGVLGHEGPCVGYSYGSGGCLRHDLIHDPICKLTDSGEADIPNYCFRPWCFVDVTTCKQSSSDRAIRSKYFPRELGTDLFYSYSTCDSTAEDWLIRYQRLTALAGASITTIVPAYTVPLMYKRNPSGDILTSSGSEYYDSSVPFEGVFMIYLEKLMGIADDNFEVTYTFGSQAGRRLHPSSKYTAAIQDIQDGLADLAIGRFWITAERLKMTSFTVPLYYDKTVLTVWVLVITLITATALLSVWFTRYGKKFRQAGRPERQKKGAYARLALDEFLHKGMFFCSAGVGQDEDATLPQKLLMFGFSFFILIVVSAYVANLAAFLTRPVAFDGTIEMVQQSGMRLCAHPALKTEFEIAWPTVNFVFSKSSYVGMLDDYAAGKCDVLAVGEMDIITDVERTSWFCERDLVLTDSLIIE